MTWPFPVLDPHIHLWDPRTTPRLVSPVVKLLGFNRQLLEKTLRALFPKAAADFVGKPDYVMSPHLPGIWRRETGDVNVRGFVHIEADWHAKGPLGPVGETEWLEELCGSDLLGIVAHAKLDSPELERVLDAHAAASKRVVGIRDMLAFDADRHVMSFSTTPGRAESAAFRRGYELLGERGLSFDAWCYHPQLPELERLVAAHPKTGVVLDHLGTPIGYGGPFASYGHSARDRERIADEWRESLAHIAQHCNVHAKLSGLAMPVLGFGWHERATPPSVDEVAERIGPLVEHALDVFGPERCIFASNFPMDKVSAPWLTLFEAFRQLTRGLGPGAAEKLFSGNATRFYGLALGD